MTLNNQSKYFEDPLATQLEVKRDHARAKRQIVYDCFHAVFNDEGVRCAREHFNNSIALLAVLRGRSTAVCVKCVDYDDGGEACG